MSRQKLIETIASRVSVTRYLDYREYLQAIYLALKNELGSYSYLSYAEDLGFSKTNVVHLIIKGKRPLTDKAADRISSALDMRSNERKYFEQLVSFQNSHDAIEREMLMQNLLHYKNKDVQSEESHDQLEFFTEWFNVAIYELALTPYFTEDPKELAGLLTPRIRPEQARKSLELLQRLGLLRKDESSGRLMTTRNRVSTGDEIASLAIIRYHQKMIDLGKESLTSVEASLRDISAISIAIPEHKLPEFKKEISALRKKLLSMADEETSPDAVYQVNFQLFPLSRQKPKKT
ncbi:MAG TPA: TIGR02147 family protein [Oligoflexus sp.]|uniref:TIGR02147 family protein n=1 Tax=Oligoflexus sp. TaxID=1971216 RepID=UPI002D4D85B7|nr:TIGR02147 family protein [Oligoflexus sp.]HYX38534.1 TIGR02147 family protein [Oligoflexus sp.]